MHFMRMTWSTRLRKYSYVVARRYRWKIYYWMPRCVCLAVINLYPCWSWRHVVSGKLFIYILAGNDFSLFNQRMYVFLHYTSYLIKWFISFAYFFLIYSSLSTSRAGKWKTIGIGYQLCTVGQKIFLTK